MRREHDTEVRLVAVPDDVEAALAAGLALEAAGWKGLEGTAIASAPTTEVFYRAVAAAFAQRGELRISSIALDGELAAFSLGLCVNARLWQLEDRLRRGRRALAPGLCCTSRRSSAATSSDCAPTSCSATGPSGRTSSPASARDYVRYTAYARGPAPTARYAARRGGRALRRAVRAARGERG